MKFKFKITSIVVVIVLICISSLTGCVHEDGSLINTTEPIATPVPTKAPQQDSSIVIPLPPGITDAHPLSNQARDLSSIYSLIFEPLVSMATGSPVGALCESWEVDATGLIWTLHLRKDVKWHGGNRTFTADDVIFTMDLIKQMTNSPYRQFLSYVDQWTKVDDLTVQLITLKPFWGFLYCLDFPILPGSGGYSTTEYPPIPVGTGPYRATSFAPDSEIQLERNDDWWKTAPSIKSITAKLSANQEASLSSLLLGQLDAMQTSDITTNQYRNRAEVSVYDYSTNYFEFLAVNQDNAILRDKKVRQAISYALDRKKIISYIYMNHAIVVDTPVPPNTALYNGDVLVYGRNTDTARDLLSSAGYKDSDGDGWLDYASGDQGRLTIRILATSNANQTYREEAAGLIANQLADVGIYVKVETSPWDDFQQKVTDGDYDLLLTGLYQSNVPDLSFLLSSTGAENYSHASSTEMDNALNTVLSQYTEQGLSAAYKQLNALIIDDLPVISLYYRTHSLLVNRDISGISTISESSAFASIKDWVVHK